MHDSMTLRQEILYFLLGLFCVKSIFWLMIQWTVLPASHKPFGAIYFAFVLQKCKSK